MPQFDRRGMCYFWTTNDWAMGYCRFDGMPCHASTADNYIYCKKFRALVRLSNKFNIPLIDLMFEDEGRKVYARTIPDFVDENIFKELEEDD